jgi:hypothetical protein
MEDTICGVRREALFSILDNAGRLFEEPIFPATTVFWLHDISKSPDVRATL